MSKARVRLGRRGESLAATALEARGYAILERNWRCAAGEADIIAQINGEWYFFEVRTRRGSVGPSPEQSLVPRKHLHMDRVARTYLTEKTSELDPTWHLSFAAVEIDQTDKVVRLSLYPDLDSVPIEAVEP